MINPNSLNLLACTHQRNGLTDFFRAFALPIGGHNLLLSGGRRRGTLAYFVGVEVDAGVDIAAPLLHPAAGVAALAPLPALRMEDPLRPRLAR